MALSFSIAAINDSISARPRLERLPPPSKEAQEARLKQTYQEALVELQAGDFLAAQCLLQSILKDANIVRAETTSEKDIRSKALDTNPMLQLKFSALKNLGVALYKQERKYHGDALVCYLQAASIDEDDVVLWSKLGTLACALGHLNVARSAFEQGILCSPGNWLCMEKLAEVLIAIGDEEACRHVVSCLLKISPSHSRAKHIDDVLQGRADARQLLKKREDFNDCLGKLDVLPRGLDLLEPQHCSLSFPKKRPFDDKEGEEDKIPNKRRKVPMVVEAKLPDLSWCGMLMSVLDDLQVSAGMKAEKTSVAVMQDQLISAEVMCNPTDRPLVNRLLALVPDTKFSPSTKGTGADRGPALLSGNEISNLEQWWSSPGQFGDEIWSTSSWAPPAVNGDAVALQSPGGACLTDVQGLKELRSENNGNSNQDHSKEKMTVETSDASKEVVGAVYEDEFPSQERRSFRLERIRTRRSDKDEESFVDTQKDEDQCEFLRQLLEPFISTSDRKSDKCRLDGQSNPDSESGLADAGLRLEDVDAHEGLVISEEVYVQQFIAGLESNCGPFHVAHELLEKLSALDCPFRIPISKLLMLESITRQFSWTKRSKRCSMFLAELCMDMFASSSRGDITSLYLAECDFHLCRVVEHGVSFADFAVSQGGTAAKQSDIVSNSVTTGSAGQDRTELTKDAAEWTSPVANGGPKPDHHVPDSEADKVGKVKGSNEKDWPLWVRYHRLNGQWHLCCGRLEEAYQELTLCSAILDSWAKLVDKSASVGLPHCKWETSITRAKVQRKLFEVQLDKLLKYSASEMVVQARYSELIDLLVPVLLPDNDPEKSETDYGKTKRGAVDTSPECIGLNMLISACEKLTPPNLDLALRCHARKLEILCGAVRRSNSSGTAGGAMDSQVLDRSPSNSEQEQGMCDAGEKLVADEVNCISNCLACIRENVGKSGGTVSCSIQPSLLQQIQRLLLDLVCHYISVYDAGGSTSSCGSFNLQFDSSSFVKALIAFCRLQHLDSCATLKQQVSLLATVHDVLAVRGLCCAGNGCEGEEGAFLKLAIKHLRTVELRLRLTIGQSKVLESDANGAMEICERLQEQLSEDIDDAREEALESEASRGKLKKSVKTLKDEAVQEEMEQRRLDLGLDSVLDQCFFCLYGLNLRDGSETSSQSDGLTEHRNTNCGGYRTKEQCAGVYQYVLPYAKAYSRSRLLKLRKVLRAVHKQFPSPPPDILADKAVDPFLDDPEFDEVSFSEMILSGKNVLEIMDFALKVRKPACDHQEMQVEKAADSQSKKQEMRKTLLPENGDTVSSGDNSQTSFTSVMAGGVSGWKYSSASHSNLDVEFSEPYLEVYENLYHFVSEIEDISASEKWPGFVLTKEGEEFVDQNAKLLKYDLCCNPLRFESWHKLAKIYDEEVDLMLNDGSKNINVVDWRKNGKLNQRVEMGRQRARRCLLITLALSDTSEKQSDMHELLALVYYESLQNVTPSYDQRHHAPGRNAEWLSLCEMALKHFEGAFKHKPHWTHLFYMGKLYEKLCRPVEDAFNLYKRAVDMKSSAVDPVYRLHASRLKLLCRSDKHDVKTVRVIAQHCYMSSVKEKVCTLFECLLEYSPDVQASLTPADNVKYNELLVEIRKQLFEDCVTVMKVCMEGELKHYHKARFRLAHGLYSNIENQDMDRAKEELAFCFRTSRSLFTINMWEIDSNLRKIKRKAAHQTNLDVQIIESSRKFIACVRKYLLLYLSMCEKTGDIYTLERAFYSLRTDKKFSLCLDDISRLSLGKYIRVLATAVCRADANDTVSHTTMYGLLEKLFNLFLDYGTSWSESLQISLADDEVGMMTEKSIYGYIHRYLNLLEDEMKVDTMEAINERIRKRFKSFKVLCSQTSEVCRHACLAWGRALCCSLASITPVPQTVGVSTSADQTTQLVLDLQEDIFRASSYELKVLPGGSKDDPIAASSPERIAMTNVASDSVCFISRLKNVFVSQAASKDLERASALLRSTYVFYRDSLSGPFPDGINLFLLGAPAAEDGSSNIKSGSAARGSEALDISTPRKLLLWAFTLVHGRTGSVAEAVKHCEEHAKSKKGSS